MEDLVQRSSLMDVQKDLLDLCPDMISPVGVRLLNAPLCWCWRVFVYKGGERVLRNIYE